MIVYITVDTFEYQPTIRNIYRTKEAAEKAIIEERKENGWEDGFYDNIIEEYEVKE